ncbi:hypothetical protein JXM83_01320 [Candidatus Woesearchaeota archaeon]|nr:hypothetical protein [Candidatus Woesearchaeota archaeon]
MIENSIKKNHNKNDSKHPKVNNKKWMLGFLSLNSLMGFRYFETKNPLYLIWFTWIIWIFWFFHKN